MRNVVVNGIDPDAADETEVRLFVQAVADLDLAHVDVLRDAAVRMGQILEPSDGDLGAAQRAAEEAAASPRAARAKRAAQKPKKPTNQRSLLDGD